MCEVWYIAAWLCANKVSLDIEKSNFCNQIFVIFKLEGASQKHGLDILLSLYYSLIYSFLTYGIII